MLGRKLKYKKGRPFDRAQGRPFDRAQGRQSVAGARALGAPAADCLSSPSTVFTPSEVEVLRARRGQSFDALRPSTSSGRTLSEVECVRLLRTSPEQVRRRRTRRMGQQVLEYAILIAAISAALMTMYVYSKRGLQAVIKAQTDSMGAQEDSEPIMTSVVTTSNSVVDTFANETKRIGMAGNSRTYNFDSFSASSGDTTSYSERY